jgi:protein SCO1/2
MGVTRPVFRVAALLAAAAVTGCAASSSGGPQAGPCTVTDKLHGATPNPPSAKPHFTLTDTAGSPYRLAAETDGKVTLLYFGYTHCPDECPTSMADVASALRRLPADVADEVSVVFVTTDPKRDRPQVLRTWLERFDPDFVGLTGTPQELAGAEVGTGLPISQREAGTKGEGAGRYSVAHFAAVLTYDRDGRLVTLYPAGVTPTDIAADLRLLVKGC